MTSASHRAMRQAVVVIHGIGEQRPMSTLRGFVANVLPASEANRSRLFSKPDRMSQTFELRRLSVEQSRRRPATDFYEYYWAHHMQGTKLRHLWPWARAILLRRPANVPTRLLPLWTLSWVLGVAAIVLLVSGSLEPGSGSASSRAGLVLAAVFSVVQALAINWLGDAARYLSPLPANIAARHAIRAEGLAFLEQLHLSGRYDRIILVGHSLGSVIGHDLLTFYWSQVNARHNRPDRVRQRALEQVERLGRSLNARSTANDVTAFQGAQRALWHEQRQLGNPWLITDFVTLGSPLAHADLLLASGRSDLEMRQTQRELPKCPPVGELPRRRSTVERFHYLVKYIVDGQPREIRVLHHAAPFAVTRWTNIYVPIRLGLLGDLVGGPLRDVFGHGIRDVAVSEGLLRFLPMLSHTRYWRGRAVARRADRITSLQSLCNALDLESAGWPRAGTTPAVDTAAPPALD
jgi:hypothetical protein